MGSISKAIKRVIPKEIQPILPIAASMFGGPLVGSLIGKSTLGSGIMSALGPIGGRALTSGLTSAATDLLTSGKIDARNVGISALMGGGGQYLKGDPTTYGPKTGFQNIKSEIGEALAPDVTNMSKLSDLTTPLSVATTTGGSIAAYDAAEKAQREYDEKMAGREADAAANRQSRIDYITRYMGLAGFSQSEIDEALSNAGYQNGGRVGYRIGGGPVTSFIAKLLNTEPTEEVMQRMVEERKKEILSGMFDAEAGTGAYSMEQMQKADEMATKQAMKELEEFKERIGMELDNPPEGSVSDDMIDQIMEPRKEGRVKEDGENQAPAQQILNQLRQFDVLPPMDDMGYMDETMQRLLNSRKDEAERDDERNPENTGRYYDPERPDLFFMKDGGIMNLKTGGMPAEMDLRPGGFVPIGVKEKADDVPARLSKNEFVMTADAVRAAGGGSVNKGAKRMYDLMNNLEARV